MELCYSKHHTRAGFQRSVHTSELVFQDPPCLSAAQHSFQGSFPDFLSLGWLGEGEHHGYRVPFSSCSPPSLPSSIQIITAHKCNLFTIKNTYHNLCRAHKNGCDIHRCKSSAGLGWHTQDESCRSDNAQAATPCAEMPAGTTGHRQEDVF